MLSEPIGWPPVPGILLEVHDVEPRVSIERLGRWRYQVTVVEQTTRLGGEFGWRATSVTAWGANRAANQIVKGIRMRRAAGP